MTVSEGSHFSLLISESKLSGIRKNTLKYTLSEVNFDFEISRVDCISKENYYSRFSIKYTSHHLKHLPGRVAQSVGNLTRKSGVPGSIPGLATYFRFSFRFFKKGSCQLLAKVCARSTGLPLRRSKPAQEKCG